MAINPYRTAFFSFFFERKEHFAWKLIVQKVNVAINPFRATFFLRARNAYIYIDRKSTW